MFIHDGVSVNSAAMDHLRVFYPHAASIICMSHTIDNVGKHFDTPCLDQFFQWWISLFFHSAKAKLRWKEQTGLTLKSFSPTRCWSIWEVIDQLCRRFGEVQTFLDDNGDVAPKTMDHIRVIFNDEECRKELQLEMAAVVDAGQHFVRATYSLGGD